MKAIKCIICILILCNSVYGQNNVCLNNQNTIPGFKDYAYGDFNNDNVIDFALGAYNGNMFAISLSNGPQSYAALTFYTVAGTPLYLTAGDFNNDGNDDLAISCYDSSKVIILNGNGAGSFTATTKYNLLNGAGFIKSADFNNDGSMDLAVSSGTNSFYIMKNNGSGGFTTMLNTISVSSFLVEDFNNDGLKDLYIVDYSNGAYFMKNLGNCAFSFQVNTTLNLNCAFDLNNDGKKDLFSWNSYSLQVSLGIGNFNFAAPTIISSPLQNTGFVAKGDLNSDGLLDICFFDMNSTSYQIAARLNNGSGGFLAPVIYTNTAWAFQMEGIESIDVDGNGKTDIVLYSDNAPRLTIIYNCSVAGIFNESNSDISIELFPNPSNGIYKLRSDVDLKTIRVYDYSGRLILKSMQNDQIDLKNYPNGIYFLKIETLDGKNKNYKLIKTD